MNLFQYMQIALIILGLLSSSTICFPFDLSTTMNKLKTRDVSALSDLIDSFVHGKISKDILNIIFPGSTSPPAAIDPTILPNLYYFAEFSAASYCDSNHNPGTEISCPSDFCPKVTSNAVVTIAQFQDQGITGTSGFVARDDTTKTIVIAFRGSSTIRNFLADADLILIPIPEFCKKCMVHKGFLDATNVEIKTILDTVNQLRSEFPQYSIAVTGHSLGGAIATLTATKLRRQGINVTLYTYGAPRIGNEQLSQLITDDGSNFRVTHLDDPVPQLPSLGLGYEHISPEYHIFRGDSGIGPNDIHVLTGLVNFNGNTGDNPLGFNATAHSHYLLSTKISACASSEIRFRI